MVEYFAKIRKEIKLDLSSLTTENGNIIVHSDGNPLSETQYNLALNSPPQFENMVRGIPKKIKRITDRGQILADGLVKVSKSIGKPIDIKSFDIFADNDGQNAELKNYVLMLEKQVKAINSRSEILAKGYGEIARSFKGNSKEGLPQYFKISFNPIDFRSEDETTVKNALISFKKDMMKLNKQLHKGSIAEQTLKKTDENLAETQKALADLNKEQDILGRTGANEKAEIKRLTKAREKLLDIKNRQEEEIERLKREIEALKKN